MLTRRLREELEREGRVIVSRALSLGKARTSAPLLVEALFYDLSSEKTVSIPSQSERRECGLQELFRKAKRPVALFVDDAQDLHRRYAGSRTTALNAVPAILRRSVTISRPSHRI